MKKFDFLFCVAIPIAFFLLGIVIGEIILK